MVKYVFVRKNVKDSQSSKKRLKRIECLKHKIECNRALFLQERHSCFWWRKWLGWWFWRSSLFLHGTSSSCGDAKQFTFIQKHPFDFIQQRLVYFCLCDNSGFKIPVAFPCSQFFQPMKPKTSVFVSIDWRIDCLLIFGRICLARIIFTDMLENLHSYYTTLLTSHICENVLAWTLSTSQHLDKF